MKIFRFCQTYLLSHKIMLIIYILLILCTVATSIFSPLIIGNFLDGLIVGGTFNTIIHFCLIFTIISLISIIIGYISTIIYVKLQSNISYQINKDIISHVQNLSLSYSNKIDSAYLMQRINNDSNELIIFCMNVIQNIIGNVIILVVLFIIMMRINLYISLFLLAFFLLYIILYFASKNILYRTNYTIKEQKDTFFSKLYEQLKYIKLIKLNSINFTDKLDKSFTSLLNVVIKGRKVGYLVYGLDNAIQILAQIMLFMIGGTQILNGNFTIGMFTIFSRYFTMVLGAGSYFFTLGTSYQIALVAYNRLSNILNNKKESIGTNNIGKISIITMTNVNLRNDNKQRISDFFNATFKEDNIYAISGTNGSGKSTIVNLIMGMYIDEKQGDIKFNGMNINEINMLELRKTQLAFAEQEPILLSDTIRYNITLTREINRNEDSKILEYAKILNIEKFISKSTLDLFLEEESTNTSGGEKQKIAILRTLYKDTSVMIFDEPTSALDSQTIKLFIQYLEKIKEKKIIIIITHNEDVKGMCDLIISID